MCCLGISYSIDEKSATRLRSLSEKDRLEFLQQEIDASNPDRSPERKADFDESWDALHRCLTDGYLDHENGKFPLSHVIMGGEVLYTKSDFIMALKAPEQVKQIAAAIEKIDKEFLRFCYYNVIKADDYDVPLSAEDFEYTWDWFNASKPFWALAAKENKYVLFTADQ